MDDVLTDNRNRTGSEIRSLFSKMGGSMAEPGAVSWQFGRVGLVYVVGSATEDDVMLAALDAGARDVVRDGDDWKVTCEPSDTEDVRAACEAARLEVLSADSTMVSSTLVEVGTAADARSVLRVMDALEEHDDVQDVYANFDIPDAIMEQVDA